MLARIQQILVLTLFAGAVIAFVAGARPGDVWIGPAFLALVVVGYAGVLAFEFCLLRRSYAGDDPERPTLRQVLRAWTVEALVAPRVFLWHQPFRSAREPDHLPADARG